MQTFTFMKIDIWMIPVQLHDEQIQFLDKAFKNFCYVGIIWAIMVTGKLIF